MAKQLLDDALEAAMAERVTAAMDRSQRNAAHIARELGMTRAAVSQWRAKGCITRQAVVPFCEITGVSVAWLMTGQGSMDPKFSPTGWQASEIFKLIESAGLSPQDEARLAAAFARMAAAKAKETE